MTNFTPPKQIFVTVEKLARLERERDEARASAKALAEAVGKLERGVRWSQGVLNEELYEALRKVRGDKMAEEGEERDG